MEIKQAVSVIKQALDIANKAGAYTIDDAAVIKVAFDSLNKEVEPKEPVQETVKSKK